MHNAKCVRRALSLHRRGSALRKALVHGRLDPELERAFHRTHAELRDVHIQWSVKDDLADRRLFRSLAETR